MRLLFDVLADSLKLVQICLSIKSLAFSCSLPDLAAGQRIDFNVIIDVREERIDGFTLEASAFKINVSFEFDKVLIELDFAEKATPFALVTFVVGARTK